MANNRQIAKNAAALYFRMIITMLVGLYTSRVVLQVLGVEDYGIYNVVGGFVAMFSLITDSIHGSVSRFLTYELGRNDPIRLKQVFSTSFYVMVGLSIIVVIATETIGIWYLYNKMVIPTERLGAAFWCFQLSVATFVLRLINAPYTSSIISHEKMNVYAYMAILDVVLKLLICFAIQISPIDCLVFYGILLFIVSCLNQIIMWAYCLHNFAECSVNLVFDRLLFKEIFGFAGWNFIGSSAHVLRTQGSNLLLNAFGGPVVNAANGIANSICSVVGNFVGNFTQAFNPQITKRYASGEYESLMLLLIYGSKYSYYLMFLIGFPVVLNANFIFQLWLGVVPEYTVTFSRWIFVFLLAESVSRPIIIVKNATGQIRNYQIVVGGVLLLMLPLSYFGLKLGVSVVVVAISNAFTATLAIFARMFMLRGEFPCWSSRVYFRQVLLNALMVSVVASSLPLLIYLNMEEGWGRLLLTSFLSLVCTALSVFYVGSSPSERTLFVSKSMNIVSMTLNKIRSR